MKGFLYGDVVTQGECSVVSVLDNLTSTPEPGGVMPCIQGLQAIRRARISAVRTYTGIDKAQPWRRPLEIKKGCEPSINFIRT